MFVEAQWWVLSPRKSWLQHVVRGGGGGWAALRCAVLTRHALWLASHSAGAARCILFLYVSMAWMLPTLPGHCGAAVGWHCGKAPPATRLMLQCADLMFLAAGRDIAVPAGLKCIHKVCL
jgi:hypothetical protein